MGAGQVLHTTKIRLMVKAFVLLHALILPHTLLAADPNAEVRANAIYKEAKESFEAGDLPRALLQVKQAEALFAHPAIVLLRGKVLHKLGNLRAADEALRLADSPQLPKPLQKPLTDERTAIADEMRQKGELTLTIDPDSARVTLDGEEVPVDYVGWLAPGKHRLEVAAPGYKTTVRTVDIVVQESAALTIRLPPVAGSLVIIAPGGLQGAEVRLDGLLVELKQGEKLGDRTPPMHIQAGPHKVICSRGDRNSVHEIEVSADGATEVTCDGITPSSGTTRKILGWTGVGVGAGLVGLGAYGILSFFLVDAKDPRYNDPRYTVSHNKVIFGSTYAVVGAAVGIASWLFLLRDNTPGEEKSSQQ